MCVWAKHRSDYAVNSEDPEHFLRFQVNPLHNQKKNSIWIQQCIFPQSAELSLTAGCSYERILMLPDSQSLKILSWKKEKVEKVGGSRLCVRASSILCGFWSGSGTEPKFLIGSISEDFLSLPLPSPLQLLVLEGTQRCLARGQPGRCRELSPSFPMQFPAGCGPGKRSAPAAPPVLPAPLVPRN